MSRRQPRYLVVSQALVRGELRGRFTAERSTFKTAIAKAVKDAKARGYHTTVEDITLGVDRDAYGHRLGYLALCTPQHKRGRRYAQCKLSTRGRKLLADS